MEDTNNCRVPDSSSGLTFHDFIPSMRKAGTITHWPSFDRFSSTIKKANEFLAAHPNLAVINCETITFHLNHEGVKDFNKADFVLYGEIHNGFVKGLRLWTQPCSDPISSPQQIGCFSILPSMDKNKGAVTTLEHLTYEANNWLKRNPVQGRIINVQTVEMRGMRHGKIDVDASSWTQAASSNSLQPHTVLQFFRVFYLVGVPCSEDIIFNDIFPIMTKSGKSVTGSEPEFEPFSAVFDKALDWLTTLPDIYRLLSMQTLQCRAVGGVPFRNIYSTFYQSTPFHKHYIKYIRITCVKYKRDVPSHPSLLKLKYHLFEPGLLQDPGKWIHLAKFESLTSLHKRVDSWVQKTGMHVITAETVSFKTNSGAERTEGHEAMYTWNETRADSRGVEQATFEQYISGVRVCYMDDSEKPVRKPEWPRTISDYRKENESDGACMLV